VAKALLDCLDVRADLDHESYGRMPQRVEGHRVVEAGAAFRGVENAGPKERPS
jgi:hypothetical protein